MKKFIHILLLIACLILIFTKTENIRRISPVLLVLKLEVEKLKSSFSSTDESPLQENILQQSSFSFKSGTITPLANFHITARVLSRHNYHSDREAQFSPVDLALGWGPMSQQKILTHISISQSNRWFYWNCQQLPIPAREISKHCANMHIIPKNRAVAARLARISPGDMIELSGSLVRVEGESGWRWQSSLTRNDSGNHACEIIYTEKIKILK
ncbi:MAG: hypothetical protein HRT88_10400 [Lentisphaeraceae bacterium]|nr:hypothetical protein [Lentisphaeraceae bacterium]